MGDDKWDFDVDDDDAGFGLGDDMQDPSLKTRRDCVVFLVDARKGMVSKGYFTKCLEAARNTLKSRIIANDKDQLGICLFGTTRRSNQMDFDNIAVMMGLDEPTPHAIQVLDDLVRNKSESEYGHSNSDWTNGFPVHEALWVCQQMFSDSVVPKDATKRIFILTDDERPTQHNTQFASRLTQKAKDMAQAGYEILLFPFSPSKTFSFDKLWADVVTEQSDALDTDELLAVVRKKVFQKRVMCNLRWAIGPGIELSVAVYNVVSPTRPASAKYLDANHAPLVSRTRYFSALTVKEVQPDDILRTFFFGGERVTFTEQELKVIKETGTTGLTLLGFKDRRRLKNYHNVKHSYFLFPSDKPIAGSTKAFFALHSQMLAKNRIALCKLVRTVNSQPRVVALVPTPKVMNPDGDAVLAYAGMHMVLLPWANEIRDVPVPEPYNGDISPEQQQATDALVDRLTMKQFSSEYFPNPALQRYYACLQSMALGQSDIEDAGDVLQPNEQALHHARRDLDKFRRVFFKSDEAYEQAIAAAKPKTSGGQRVRAARPQLGADGQYDWEGLAASGQLGALTATDLKLYLKDNNLRTTGKKDELVDRVATHIQAKKRD